MTLVAIMLLEKLCRMESVFVSPCSIREAVEKPKIVRSSLTIDNDLGTKCLPVEVQWGLPPFFNVVGEGQVKRGGGGGGGGGLLCFLRA